MLTKVYIDKSKTIKMEGIQAKEKECCGVTGEGSVETGGV